MSRDFSSFLPSQQGAMLCPEIFRTCCFDNRVQCCVQRLFRLVVFTARCNAVFRDFSSLLPSQQGAMLCPEIFRTCCFDNSVQCCVQRFFFRLVVLTTECNAVFRDFSDLLSLQQGAMLCPEIFFSDLLF
jgi:hypothetical protein